MSQKYSSMFEGIHQFVAGSPLAGWVLILAILTLVIGVNGFIEDTYSSYVGVQMIEKTFSVRPASWEFTYWAMSLFFQVVSVLSLFAYLSNRDQNWYALWIGMGAQVIDFAADVWYRSNGTFSAVNVTVSFVMTFIFFTVGSEIALTFGFGLVSALFVEGSVQLAISFRNLLVGFQKFMKMLASGKVDGSQPSQYRPEYRTPPTPPQQVRPPEQHPIDRIVVRENKPNDNHNGERQNQQRPFQGGKGR